jgi:CheY-like chemotaxis protein
MQNFMQGARLNAPNLKSAQERDPFFREQSIRRDASATIQALFTLNRPNRQREADQIALDARDIRFMTAIDSKELATEESIRILVMDDSPVIRHLIVAMLDDIDSVDEVVEVADAPAAISAVAHQPPLIAILDIKVPGDNKLRNGIDVLREIKRISPETDVIMLTNHAIPLYRETCMMAGASFFLDKSSEFDQLPEAIESILHRAD